jgi:ribosome maturation factor RimP
MEAEAKAGDLTPGAALSWLTWHRPPVDVAPSWRNIGDSSRSVAGRQLAGRVLAVSEVGVSLDVKGLRTDVAFAELSPGRVQIEFGRLAELSDDDLGPEIVDGDSDKDAEDQA